MINIKLIRENPKLIIDNMKKRYMTDKIHLVNDLMEKDDKWRTLKKEIDELRKQRNELSKKINAVKKNKDIAVNPRALTELFSKAKDIPKKIKSLEEEAIQINVEIDKILRVIPNIMHESVPRGKTDEDNVEIKVVGEKRHFGFKVLNHVAILEGLGLADFNTAADLSGNGFYVLKGDVARLNQALIQFAINKMQEKGFTYIEPPLMIRKKVLDAAMDTEEFANTIYKVEGEDLNMIGTSEHALLGLHAGKAIPEDNLPLKYFAYSMCFRKEIGSHGINEKGLWRTHQFNKVEQFVFCKPEDSYKMYEEMQAISEELFSDLKLPYRIVECCSGDLAMWKAKSADMEVWRPTTESYGEITSLSNTTDFQARGVKTKVLRRDGTREVLHTLNNTAIATSRALVGIIENYQNEDGTINVPEVLQPLMGGLKVITHAKPERE